MSVALATSETEKRKAAAQIGGAALRLVDVGEARDSLSVQAHDFTPIRDQPKPVS